MLPCVARMPPACVAARPIASTICSRVSPSTIPTAAAAPTPPDSPVINHPLLPPLARIAQLMRHSSSIPAMSAPSMLAPLTGWPSCDNLSATESNAEAIGPVGCVVVARWVSSYVCEVEASAPSSAASATPKRCSRPRTRTAPRESIASIPCAAASMAEVADPPSAHATQFVHARTASVRTPAGSASHASAWANSAMR